MDQAKHRVQSRGRIRARIRGKVTGTGERPRLAVFKSLKHVYVQLIDDASGTTLASASTHEKDAGAKGANAASAKAVDRKSTRLNSSHANISYAVFCLKKQ